MGLLTTVRQAYTLASPYFSPVRGNWGRIGGVAGSVFMMAFRAQYDGVMHKRMYAFFDFFQQKRPIAEFNGVFRAAVGGFVSIMATDMVREFLQKRLELSFQNAMLKDTLERWLKEENYLGVKTRKWEISKKICCTLEDKIPNFTSTTLTLVIERVGDLVINLLSLYRIYHLSKPLYSKSLQFPFNRPGGVFAVMIGILGVFSWIKIRAQAGIAKSHALLNQKESEALDLIGSLEGNALQTASLLLKYRKNILDDIKNTSACALSEVSSFKLTRLFNTNMTFMFPNAFQLSLVYLASLFAKVDPENFDYTNSFLPLFRECMNFMWRSTSLIQGVLDDWLKYDSSVQRIRALSEVISQYENRQKTITITRGAQLSIQDLTVKVMKDKDEKTLFSQLNLNIDPGSVYFVSGENGSGKTVLLQTIAGVHTLGTGRVTVPGPVSYLQPKIEIDPAKADFAGILRKTFGMIDPEEVGKVRSYLKEFRSFYPDGQWKFPEVIEGKRDWFKLSDGEKQVLNLAVNLTMMEKVTTPLLILADEILGQVDDRTKVGLSSRAKALDLLKKLANGAVKHTILLVDHSGAGMEWDKENKITKSQGADFEIYKLN